MQPKLILTALGFLTRLPMPAWVPFDGDSVARAARWFALVGLLIGALAAGCLWLLEPYLGQPLAVVLTLVLVLRLTGAFHEDGLADWCDGFGGHWLRQRKLEIMKDSQIGTYGVLALVAAFAIKAVALSMLPLGLAMLALVICHAGGRAVAGLVPVLLPYARDEGNSKTPQRDRAPGYLAQLTLMICAAVPLLALPYEAAAVLVLAWSAAFAFMVWNMNRHIQGYTGDTLGATEQVVELMTLLVLVAMFNQGYL
ncbi:adenosylcobinamide-GDP ribazoletransferase [Ferrimonas sp. SCSIO 43195]|uniref:adenosylcobinamide-GDP ribazoletransferase n=1 Tax=Ferrimonas sp. SCSIO 43195 TaxID=2822844 RepID=UPI00207613A8|nr:adenosylcobinamide-GDP ribazoletransferase [Ferrimonas sp. SCSIO 43195]USD39386.1 adenosylcobinamide-GDP ribazoletransferase [Ferrimonas sp. SCSIO 43195]